MGLIHEIENSSIVAVDTTVFIYYIEKNPKYFDLLETIFKKCNSKEKPFKLITSMVTLIEVLTKPLKESRKDLVDKYKEILLNIASALVSEADCFISNDKRLRDISEIESLILDDLLVKLN